MVKKFLIIIEKKKQFFDAEAIYGNEMTRGMHIYRNGTTRTDMKSLVVKIELSLFRHRNIIIHRKICVKQI